jgi:hypothetical protein
MANLATSQPGPTSYDGTSLQTYSRPKIDDFMSIGMKTKVLFTCFIIYTFQLVFSAGTVFSHDFLVKRTGTEIIYGIVVILKKIANLTSSKKA